MDLHDASGASRRRAAAFGLAVLLLAVAPATAEAQAQARLARVGVLFVAPVESGDLGRFGRGMRELGWVEGRNVAYEVRSAGGRIERLPAGAEELVRAGVDVLVAGGPGPLAALRQATQTVPIVVVGGADPVAEGWARSLARPTGNVTGLTVTIPGLDAKRLALLKEAMPRLARVAVLFGPNELSRSVLAAEMEPQAQALGVELLWHEVRDPADIERAFDRAREQRAEGLITIETPSVISTRVSIGALALRDRLPWVAEFTAFGTAGQLMAYGPDLSDLLYRAAGYVDRILKGARPGELPIERPARLELVLNRGTARSLGFVFPPTVLLRADRFVD